MKILILGAGKVGATLASHLSGEAEDITIVDLDEEKLRELRDRFDLQTVVGHASRPDVLRRAGADSADMLIAVTGSDEVNMGACQVSYSLYRTPTKIARIRSNAYTSEAQFFSQEHMPIDFRINPEEVVIAEIKQLLQHPGASRVLDFANGLVQLVAMRAHANGPLVGNKLSTLKDRIPNTDTRVAAIFRKGAPIDPTGETVVEVDDEVFFIAKRGDINAVMAELHKIENPFKRIVIAGGGNIGEGLAQSIEKSLDVKVIELDEARADEAAELLNSGVVILGNATDRDLLIQENIENSDVFCALTNDDETNIMSSMLAKQLGVRQVMTLISKPAYIDLVQGGTIDIAISPQLATASTILNHIRHADVAKVHSLRRGAAEAMEAVVHGDTKSSKIAGRRIADLNLPKGVSIGAIVRANEVLIAHDNVVVESDDHVILFLVDAKQVHSVERLFQVNLNFF